MGIAPVQRKETNTNRGRKVLSIDLDDKFIAKVFIKFFSTLNEVYFRKSSTKGFHLVTKHTKNLSNKEMLFLRLYLGDDKIRLKSDIAKLKSKETIINKQFQKLFDNKKREGKIFNAGKWKKIM